MREDYARRIQSQLLWTGGVWRSLSDRRVPASTVDVRACSQSPIASYAVKMRNADNIIDCP
jgi:hypothetical protein